MKRAVSLSERYGVRRVLWRLLVALATAAVVAGVLASLTMFSCTMLELAGVG